jgi:hypothetical protein
MPNWLRFGLAIFRYIDIQKYLRVLCGLKDPGSSRFVPGIDKKEGSACAANKMSRERVVVAYDHSWPEYEVPFIQVKV